MSTEKYTDENLDQPSPSNLEATPAESVPIKESIEPLRDTADLEEKIAHLRDSIVGADEEKTVNPLTPVKQVRQRKQGFVGQRIFEPIIKLWEVEDNLPEGKVDAVVGMSLAQSKSGEIGDSMGAVTEEIYDLLKADRAGFVIISNRFTTNQKNDLGLMENSGTVLADLVKAEGVIRGIKTEKIITPDKDKNLDIRNTFTEAEFAIRECKERGFKSLQIVANHIHMRRVLETFNAVIDRENYPIKLYWKSVGQYGYGINASAQHRFIHPLFFLGYEALLSYLISRVLGWSKSLKSHQ